MWGGIMHRMGTLWIKAHAWRIHGENTWQRREMHAGRRRERQKRSGGSVAQQAGGVAAATHSRHAGPRVQMICESQGEGGHKTGV